MKSDYFLFVLFISLLSLPAFAQDTKKAAAGPATAAPPAIPPRPKTATLSLFDGKTLTGWKETKFGGAGSVEVENGEIRIDMGSELTGITWTNVHRLPKTNYEISLEAKRRDGTDFFC